MPLCRSLAIAGVILGLAAGCGRSWDVGNGGFNGGAETCEDPDGLCLSLQPPLAARAGALGIVTTDCDGNGTVDILVANSNASSISVFVGRGDGSFEPGVEFESGDDPWIIAPGDFDGDQAVDLAIGNFVYGAHVLMGDGGCGFGPPIRIVSGDPDGMFSSAGYSVVAADFDADGLDDVIVAGASSGGAPSLLAPRWSNGDGTFEAGPHIYTTSDSGFLRPVDLDGDGDLDLVGGATWLDGGNGRIVVITNRGDRVLSFDHELPVTPSSYGVEIIRFGDGAPGIVAASDGSGGVLTYFRGLGDGNFGVGEVHGVGAGVSGLTSADFDGDGQTDLAVAHGDRDEVSIVLTGAGGIFGAPRRFSTGDYPSGNHAWHPYHLASADFDSDGRADLAATNFDGQVSVLLSSP